MKLLRGDAGMELLSRMERTILQWLREVPRLPSDVRRWFADNIWWITLVGAILTGISAFGLIIAVFSNVAMLNSQFIAYYASTTFVTLAIIKSIVSLIFTILTCVLLSLAVTPLKEKQKKGWVLIFAAWLVSVLSVVVGAIITLNPFSFLTDIIFGAVGLLIGLYFLFEVHGQYAHVEKSKGVKKNA